MYYKYIYSNGELRQVDADEATSLSESDLSDLFCAECGTDLRWQLIELKGKAYELNNGDFACSMKCLREYAFNYFKDYKTIKIKA